MKKQHSELPMMAMPIILRYLPGITLEKRDYEYIFNRGNHNVAISFIDEGAFFKDEKDIALCVIEGIVRLEVL